ncbi:hypothetical protein [Nostoc sp. C117]|uniref:hypothetical protein n=1 Tax=Nostoc sp. C117 TaxID=3349875 RepID=UPI00370D26FE
MDFIKKLISGLLGFVGSILGLVTGLLPGGKKKSNGYFLELEEAASDSRPAAAKSVKSEVSNGKKASKSSDPEPQVESQPEKSSEANTTKKTKVEASQNGKAPEPAKVPAAATKKAPTETTFAPKYLAPSATSSNGRRLPGANMSAYLDMARQVKTPNN